MQDFRKLRVWHAAKLLAAEVVRAFPRSAGRTVPGLRSQIIRATTSVSDNISEGCGRSSSLALLSFLETAGSSLNEVDNQLDTARKSRVIGAQVHRRLVDNVIVVRKMLTSLQRSVSHAVAKEQLKRARRRKKR